MPVQTEPAAGSRSSRKRDAIVIAATRLFLERGYEGTSMDDVAEAAVVSKPTVYHHFADKKSLYGVVTLKTVSQIDALVTLVVRSSEDVTNVREALERLAFELLKALLQPDLIRLRRLVIATADQFPDIARAWYEAGFRRVLSTLADTFSQLSTRGVLLVDDAHVAANHFAGLLLWIPMNEAMFGWRETLWTKARISSEARAAVRAFLHGYAPASTRRSTLR